MSVDLDEIQANVLRGFRSTDALPLAEYLFFTLGDPDESRAWLKALQCAVTSCADWDRWEGDLDARFVVNVGFTWPGLYRLAGRDPRAPAPRCDFSSFEAFVAGAKARSECTPALGDTGASSPACWEPHYTSPDLHALISLSAQTQRGLETARAIAARALAKLSCPAGAIGRELGARLPGGAEHFGFADGIGQPDIAGIGLLTLPGGGTPQSGGWEPVPLGQFVLGYANALNVKRRDGPLLSNGSFLVFRKLRQDVSLFRAYVRKLAERTQQCEELLAARLVGRWRSGAPLVLAPTQDDRNLGSDPHRNNDFRYADDSHGYRCPIGAHIRRANPRDEPTGPTTRETASHRLIRRSIPYGSPLALGAKDDGAERGLLFVALNADIAQQFEFVQSSWINSTLSSTRLTLGADKDPILGAHDGTGKLVMPAPKGTPTFAWELPRFVSVRGSAYFFWPSRAAIERLSSGVRSEDDWPF